MYYKKKSFLIITVSLEKTGRGHIIRSKNLYNFLKKKRSANLVVIDKKIFKNKSNYVFFDNLKKLLTNNKIIILDLSNYFFLRSPFFLKLFYFLKKYENKIVIIDSLYRDSILNYYNFINPIMIYPYIMNKKSLFNLKYYTNKKRYLIGPQYFIADKKNNNVKVNKKTTRKILVSCGGSDKENCTLKVINFYLKNIINFKITCVIGPFFNKMNVLKIKNFVKYYKLEKKVKLLFNVKNLVRIFDKFGFIICTSGVTKYEVIAHRIPSIVITPNKYQEKYHSDFARKKISFTIKSSDLKNKNDFIIKFLNNFILLKRMVNRAAKFIDFKGSERIEKILISDFK